jgi:hypothetical protein
MDLLVSYLSFKQLKILLTFSELCSQSTTINGNASEHDNVGETTMKTDYQAARIVAHLLSILGWILILFGLACGSILIANLGGGPHPALGALFSGFILLGPTVGGLLVGLLFLANGQLVRASVDSADYNREILALMTRANYARPAAA